MSSLAASRGLPLRLRLRIGASATSLHVLRGETLVDPLSRRPFATDEKLPLSRFISSTLRPPPGPLDRAGLTALVVVANPTDLGEYRLPAIDVEETLARASRALSGIPVTVLPSGGQANLDNIMSRLRDGCDIFYLVAHGGIGKTRLELDVAQRLCDVYPDQFMAELQPGGEPLTPAALRGCAGRRRHQAPPP